MLAYYSKKIFKVALIMLLIGTAGLITTGAILSKPLPEIIPNSERAADSLAIAMLNTLNWQAWKNTEHVSWDFGSRHAFDWDRKNDRVTVQWKSYKAEFNTSDHLSGKAWKKEQELDGEKRNKALEEAWKHFCNDSFWLAAPFKVFDEGTTRALVDLGDGEQGLLVSYSSGGVTPGDSYLWILDENNRPVAWKMWVKIIPIGGIKATWEDYFTLDSGAVLSTSHKLFFFRLELEIR